MTLLKNASPAGCGAGRGDYRSKIIWFNGRSYKPEDSTACVVVSSIKDETLFDRSVAFGRYVSVSCSMIGL